MTETKTLGYVIPYKFINEVKMSLRRSLYDYKKTVKEFEKMEKDCTSKDDLFWIRYRLTTNRKHVDMIEQCLKRLEK